MSEKLKILTFGVLILAAVSSLAMAVDVSGTWEITVQTPRGDERTSEMTIAQDGEKITVTMEGFQGDELTAEGTIKDDKIEWTVNISSQRGDFSITYTGTVEGDTMTGEAQMADFGTMEWSAKKK